MRKTLFGQQAAGGGGGLGLGQEFGRIGLPVVATFDCFNGLSCIMLLKLSDSLTS